MHSQQTTLLIVEDEQAIADTLSYYFQNEGYKVMHTSTCQEALDILQEQSIHLALLDIGLPDGSGLELCKQIRARSALPILFLSARDDEVDRVVGLEIGADDYISKPFSPRELLARIKAVLRRTQPSLPEEEPSSKSHSRKLSPLTVDSSFQIDEEACQISYQHTLIQLTKSEYQLLRTLLLHPYRVFSREQLLTHISDDPGSALDRVIDAHIKALRSKLNNISPEGATCIQTRRGLGYSFQPLS